MKNAHYPQSNCAEVVFSESARWQDHHKGVGPFLYTDYDFPSAGISLADCAGTGHLVLGGTNYPGFGLAGAARQEELMLSILDSCECC
jgi:hypothetical protein